MRTSAHKDQLGVSRLVDQQPIGRDMTFAVANVIARQGVVSVAFWQRLFRLQRPYNQSQLIEIVPRRKKLFEVLLEPALADKLEH
jgi:hypothetical protein